MRVLKRSPFLLSLLLAAATGRGQQAAPGKAAIRGVEDLQTGKVQAAEVVKAQGVEKVEGLNKVEGVKPPPQSAVAPPPPPPPPPPPASAVPAGGTAIGSAATIRPVQGITGIETLKRQNLETALQIKTGGATPAGTGAEKGGKGKAAAAALLTGDAEVPAPKPAPVEDGRAKLQEVKKLLESGS